MLYTLTNSKHLTMASGVHGIIDLTVPAGGSSGSTVEEDDVDGVGEAKRDLGSMNRILRSG